MKKILSILISLASINSYGLCQMGYPMCDINSQDIPIFLSHQWMSDKSMWNIPFNYYGQTTQSNILYTVQCIFSFGNFKPGDQEEISIIGSNPYIDLSKSTYILGDDAEKNNQGQQYFWINIPQTYFYIKHVKVLNSPTSQVIQFNYFNHPSAFSCAAFPENSS